MLLQRSFKTFAGDRRGTAALELALIIVPFLLVLFSVIETSIVLMLSLSVDRTAQQIARVIKTGVVQASNIQTAADFRSKLLCPAQARGLLPPYLDCSRVVVDIRSTSSLAAANLSNDFYNNAASQQFCMGGSQSIVVVRVAYSFPAILPMLFGGGAQSRLGLVNDVPNFPGWNHLMLSATAFQNEYSGGGSQPAC